MNTSEDKWYTWRWDHVEASDLPTTWTQVDRWRRGSLLTVYRFRTADGATQWWFYLPFNLGIGFASPGR
jgi:hypothetical protein